MNQENKEVKSKCCVSCYSSHPASKGCVDTECKCHTPQSLEEKGKHQISQERIHEIYKEIKEREEKQNPPTDSNWEDKLALIVAQSAPTTLLSLWKNADFNWLKENVGNLIQSEREKEREKCRNIFINSVDWAEWGMSDEDASKKFDEDYLSSNKPSNE